MRRESNKKRKLKFIRAKNNLRTGKVSFYCTQKVSVLFKEDYGFFENLREISVKSLLKNYKLNIHDYKKASISVDSNFIEDDILKNLRTWVCKINLQGK